MKQQFFLILSLSLMLFSCKDKPQKNIPISKGLATPIYLNQTNTDIFLSDYIINPLQIDSVAHSESYRTQFSKDKRKLQITPNEKFQKIDNLRLYVADQIYDIPLYKSTKKKAIFSLETKDSLTKVQFKSQIVGWQTVPMQWENNSWKYKANLDPGSYQYLFVIDGKEQLDPNNPKKISNGQGGYNSLYENNSNTEDPPFLTTDLQKGVSFKIKTTKELSGLNIYLDNHLLEKAYYTLTEDDIEIQIPKNAKSHHILRIYGFNAAGRSNDLTIPIKNGKVITHTSDLAATDFQTQIMYFLMIDRFLDGNPSNTHPIKSDSVLPKVNYMGGDLQGVVNKIKDGFFDDLGINTIWLSPITQNPEKAYGFWPDPVTKFSGYHGYWPVSNTQIDYRFGNDSIFTNLLQQAHQKKYRVLLDYVANHVHKENPIYKQHPDWATNMYLPDGTLNLEKWDSHRLTTWFDTFLPTLDFSKKEVVEAMTDSAAYWVTKFDLDGFRHDATKHIQQQFWRRLTTKIKTQTQRPIYQIGETYGSPELIRSYVNTGMLNGQFNFNLYDASVAVFAQKDEPIKRLADALTESLLYYGSNHLMGNITGNQDRARFISYASGDVRFDEDAKKAGWTRKIILSDSSAYNQLEMLHAFNLTTPGIPCIYYGDEYGMIGANDPDNRRMMKFDHYTKKEKHLKERVKELIAMRKQSMALLYGTTQVTVHDNVMIITRNYFKDKVIIVFNKSDKPAYYKTTKILPNTYQIIETN